jgi:cell division protein FtsW (lipid II flippase)
MLMAMAGLIAIGIATIYAAGNPAEPDPSASLSVPAGAWKKQVVYAAAGLVAFVLINLINYGWLGAASYWIYAVVLAVLSVLLLDKIVDIPFVPVINYSRRWIKIVPGYDVKIQPSEFCKIAYILALAWYLRYRSNYRQFLGLVGPFALTLLAIVLILLEPDLGTVMLMMPILFAMLFVAGARVRHLLAIIGLAVLVSPLLWHFMHSYQRMRISSVLLQNETIMEKARDNPRLANILAGGTANLAKWKRNQGYHLMHSKYAIASGGVSGYGFAKGPYIRYNYLPERHNDFIFAIIGHQWGLVGCGVVLGLYALIAGCGIEIAQANTDPFARLISVGIIAMFAVEVIVNISMTLGLMPITGLTLPLVSYGGSSLVVSMIAVGLLNNVGRGRPFSVAGKGFEHITD